MTVAAVTGSSIRLPENFSEWPVGMQRRFERFASLALRPAQSSSNGSSPSALRSASKSAIA